MGRAAIGPADMKSLRVVRRGQQIIFVPGTSWDQRLGRALALFMICSDKLPALRKFIERSGARLRQAYGAAVPSPHQQEPHSRPFAPYRHAPIRPFASHPIQYAAA